MSKKSKWYISKYRYLELKNMCFQYPEWKKEIAMIDSGLYSFSIIKTNGEQVEFKDPTFNAAERKERLLEKINIIETTTKLSGTDLSAYILKCVCFGKSYAILQPPCGRRQFYERYRKFFWMLDKVV